MSAVPPVPAVSAGTGGPVPFGERLRAALDERGPLCVGIDPHAALLRSWGLDEDLPGLERFARTVVDALAEHVAVLKPQSAFFERFGSRGVAVLERCVADARAGGALVLLDAKRGDIGSTVEAYARAYLLPDSPLRADALTASPYLGVGALQPLFRAAASAGTGVFVLALTSNPEGARVQRALTAGGTSVAGAVLEEVAALNAGARPLGAVGVVVGATVESVGHDLGGLGGAILAPGLGAQGAGPGDLRRLFGSAGAVLGDVVPSYSRSVLQAGPDPDRLRAAAAAAAAECRVALTPA